MSFRRQFDQLGQISLILAVLVAICLVPGSYAAETGSQTSVRPVMVPANFNQLAGPQAVVRMPQEMLDPSPAAVRLRFYDPPVEYGTAEVGGETYQTMQMLGEANTLEPGFPDVPRIARLLMVDRTGNVDLTILNQQFHIEQGGVPAPVQPLQGDNGYEPSVPVLPADEIYANNDWYPAQIATISEPMTLRDIRFVILNIFPVQVNPVTGERRVYDDLEVIVENVGGTGPNEILFVPTSISPSFKKMYSMFENFEDSAIDALPVFPGNMLIFCSTDATVISNVGELAQWKKLKGIDVSVRSGTWTTQAIRDTITAVYNQTGGKLEYVCLVGDPDNGSGAYYVPTHWTGSESSSQWDNYYGTLSSGGPNPDPVPDVAVGRLSNIETSDALVGIIRKTTRYEAAPSMAPDSGWFTRAWCASNTGHIASNPSTKEYTRQIMLQHGVNTVYWNVYGSSGVTADLAARIGSGISVFNYRLSYIGEFGPADITTSTVPADPRTPFVMVVTCGTGSFQTGESLSERWLKPPAQTTSNPAGAIGCVGVATLSTSVPYNNVIDAGAMYALYGLDLEEQGPLLVAAKLQLYLNYWNVGHSGQVQQFSYWSNLMGDPSVPIWIKQPLSAVVTKPTSIAVGANNVAISVADASHGTPVNGALVCLEKGSWSSPESWTRGYTSGLGAINLPVTITTTGYLYVTITKDDLRTVRDSILVNAASGLAYNSRTVDDDNSGGTIGNSNGVLNPGETIDLSIGIHNYNGSTISGISGTLSTSSPGITITQGVSAYANIAAGGNGTNSTPFRFTVSSVFNGEPVSLYLSLTSGSGSFYLRLDFTPASGDVTYVSNVYSGPGGSYDPGESGNVTVTFQNSGAALQSLISAQGILRSLDPYVIVNDSLGAYGTVTAGSNATNSGDPYNVTLSSQSFNGRVARMQLVVHDNNGFRDSTNFSITIGTASSTSPSGPDAYGYYAYDNTETQPAGIASTYSWIEIAPGLGGSGTSFNWDDQLEDGDDYGVLTLPFTARMYGQTFVPSQITVCDNGWLAFGNYAMWDYRNYRMGTPIGPPYMVAAYWDDLEVQSGGNMNVFYYYDPANHWYVVEWLARTQYTNVTENFEVIIYDPAYYPSVTGDCKIKVQYQTVNLSANSNTNDNDYASIGIQDGDHAVGLDYYYWNELLSLHPGAATIAAGRSIMYTTDATGQLNPIVTVNTPNGGETFYIGQSYNVLWSTSAISGNMNVYLNRAYPGPTWETLFSNTPNDGLQAWTAAGSPTTAARIRVTSVSTPSAGDTSNANFTIAAPTAQITQPNGGEFLSIGDPYSIQYVSTGLGAATVSINRNYPAGSWDVIDAAAAGDVYWVITGPGTSNARIRVIGNAAPAYGDTSDANFTIGLAPTLSHDQHPDGAPGAATFTALVTDDAGGFVTKLFYRVVGAANFDSLTFTSTGNPDEFSAVTPVLAAGYYEYFVRCTDAQNLSVYEPSTGTHTFDLAELSTAVIFYDDGGAENYNWVDGIGFKWAVKFDAPSYPYALCNAKFAVCPTAPQTGHQAARVTVYSADGPGGLPGTILFSDTSGAAGNIIGGLPAGAAWADVVTRLSNSCLTINSAFYIAVENVEPRLKPDAFATDTSVTRAGRSYFWDECDGQWFIESSGDINARPGDRMIRAAGWTVTPPTITVIKNGSNASLNWTATGAPYYKVYAATTLTGGYAYIGSTSTNSYNDPTPWVANANRFYQVTSSDAP
ncbi:hypothetical protein HZB60_11955 [candidate division KSB1 bacterium]|nr:hypothetical protein [candidate division KSB1 bacterium]